METKYKSTPQNTKKYIDTKNRTIIHYISTKTEDRNGEIMNPKGCDAEEFLKNPVVFFAHRSNELPIGKCELLEIKETGIIAKTKFYDSEFAREIFKMNTEGFLNSWSIGFTITEPPEIREGKVYINKWKLLEYSSVPIPANPECNNLILKGLFLNKKMNDLKVLKIKNKLEQLKFKVN
ncbi:MAG: HK97 family phage prohead protease [Ignavibacteria bacterium]|nr:HK97 family phage prohead protease [Ignavibacteria bacterium]